jgi:pimeloyl-ACP methyl ester carboxylesterase
VSANASYSGELIATCSARIGARELTLAEGQSAVVLPGVRHTFWNPGDEEVRFVAELRPALNTEEFETAWGLARDGKATELGVPRNPLQLAVLASAHKGEAYFIGFPWPPTANRHKAVGFTPEHFHYAFANTLSREESDEVYERYHIPASGRLVWVGATANFTPGHQEDYVDFKNENRAPLLFIAGSEDNIMPPAVNQSNVKHYPHAKRPTDYKEFEGRSHYSVIGGEGGEEVADYALEWAVEHAATRPAS